MFEFPFLLRGACAAYFAVLSLLGDDIAAGVCMLPMYFLLPQSITHVTLIMAVTLLVCCVVASLKDL